MGSEAGHTDAFAAIDRLEGRSKRLKAIQERYSRTIASYRLRYGANCFQDDNAFLCALYFFAMREKVLPHLQRTLERRLERAIPDFADQYVNTLLAQARHLAAGGDVKLDPSYYYWMEVNAAEQDIQNDREPDTTALDAILLFLERHMEDSLLANPEALDCTQFPKLDATRRSRQRYVKLESHRKHIDDILYQYTQDYGHNCFKDNPEFVRALYLLAKAKGVLLVLQGILERHRGHPVDNFAPRYEELLVATFQRRIVTSEIHLDVSQYLWDAYNAAYEQIRRDEDPDVGSTTAIVEFLTDVRRADELAPFRRRPPEASMPDTTKGGPTPARGPLVPVQSSVDMLDERTHTAKEFDAFLCHASEDKSAIVIPFAQIMQKAGLRPWLDAAQVGWGDSLVKAVEHGLTKSRFVIVFISQAFLKKDWPEKELRAALGMEIGGAKKVLPVLLGIEHDQLQRSHPFVADKLYRAVRPYDPSKPLPDQQFRGLLEALERELAQSESLKKDAYDGQARRDRDAEQRRRGRSDLSGAPAREDSVQHAGLSQRRRVIKRRAVILTALDVEFSAVQSHLRDVREERHPQGTIYQRGSFSARGVTWDVLLAQTGKGNIRAAHATERAIAHFKPQIACFVGVAGGLHNVSLGDVVAATKVYGYEFGKAGAKKFLPRPETWLIAHAAEQRARAEARNESWRRRVNGLKKHARRARVLVEPLTAGEKVVASKRATLFRFLRDQFSDAVAVEMESGGLCEAVHANPSVMGLVVRGVSDLIDKKSASDAAGWQRIAAAHAAAFAFEVIAKLVPVGHRARPVRASTRNDSAAAPTAPVAQVPVAAAVPAEPTANALEITCSWLDAENPEKSGYLLKVKNNDSTRSLTKGRFRIEVRPDTTQVGIVRAMPGTGGFKGFYVKEPTVVAAPLDPDSIHAGEERHLARVWSEFTSDLVDPPPQFAISVRVFGDNWPEKSVMFKKLVLWRKGTRPAQVRLS